MQDAVWLSGLAPFGQAELILQRSGRLSMSAMSIWRSSQHWGRQWQAQAAGERVRANALPGRWTSPERVDTPPPRMGVGMDGAMVHLRQEGWKELKVGTLFEVAVSPTLDAATGAIVDCAHAVQNSYVAHLDGPEIFGELVWAEAQRRTWAHAPATRAIADGAPWIWQQVSLHFGDAQQLVDWYHAKHHLSEAARLLNGQDTPAYHRWLNQGETLLYQGHAACIADQLSAATAQHTDKTEPLPTEANYCRHNHLRMNYLEMREQQWPIGSGMVESGAKQCKARFCGPRMRWSRSAAENLLPIRSAPLADPFDMLWRKVYAAPLN